MAVPERAGVMWSLGQKGLLVATLCLLAFGIAGVAVADSEMGHDEPLNVTAACGSSSATVSWSSVSNSHILGYDVYKRVASSGPYSRSNSAPVTATQFTVTGLSSGTTFEFGVVSVFSDGHSSTMSATASCTAG